jgi:hypothetical protein
MESHSSKENKDIKQEGANVGEIWQGVKECLDKFFHAWYDIYTFKGTEYPHNSEGF